MDWAAGHTAEIGGKETGLGQPAEGNRQLDVHVTHTAVTTGKLLVYKWVRNKEASTMLWKIYWPLSEPTYLLQSHPPPTVLQLCCS